MCPFPFRLAAVDLDDTLLGHDKQVSAANRNALQQLQSQGVQIVLASGRRHENMARFHSLLNLTGYIISAQGALAKHAETAEIVYDAPLDPSLGSQIIHEGLARNLAVICYHHDAVYGQGPADRLDLYARLSADRVTYHDLPSLAHQPMEKILWLTATPADIPPLMTEARGTYAGRADTVNTEPTFLEFTAHGVNKASALAALAHHLHIPRQQVLAFGDGNNDVAMLRWAGLGIAMAHAKPAAKDAANLTASPGDPETSFARGVTAALLQANVSV